MEDQQLLGCSHCHWRYCSWLAEQFMKSDAGLLMNIVLASSERLLPAHF